jgi:hypothetical protein
VRESKVTVAHVAHDITGDQALLGQVDGRTSA